MEKNNGNEGGAGPSGGASRAISVIKFIKNFDDSLAIYLRGGEKKEHLGISPRF